VSRVPREKPAAEAALETAGSGMLATGSFKALFQLNILQTVVFSDHTHAVCREELTRPGLVMQTSGER
jgi:hypothetical protein